MRPDMRKVIVTRPRGGASKTPRVQRPFTPIDDPEAYDSGPRHEGMRRWHLAYHGWGCKEQTDLLSPLRRLLRRRVGQDWNHVWSEICRHADARALMGLHLRSHVSNYVARAFEGKDGKLYDTSGQELIRAWWGWKFYIDPTTNQLCSLEPVSHTRRVDLPKVFALDDLLLHQHEDGHWYRVKMAVWDGMSCVADCFLRNVCLTRERLQTKYGLSPTGAVWYCIHKEAASRKDIRKVRKEYHEFAASV